MSEDEEMAEAVKDETKILGQIVRKMEDLDPEAQVRVLNYLRSRYPVVSAAEIRLRYGGGASDDDLPPAFQDEP